MHRQSGRLDERSWVRQRWDDRRVSVGGGVMKELSLFSGAGGGLLASKHLLGWRTIGYVEIEEYCQKVIAQRIKDGLLDEAPIFTDIKSFNRDGYAEIYKGLVDVISGGFPCQDISCAGKGAGITGKRSGMWFEMETAIRTIRPRYVFIENSPMLLIRGFDRVLCGLSEMGYDARWGIISAADVGAPHLRKRIWVVAQSQRTRTRDKAGKASLQRRDGPETRATPIRQGHGEVGSIRAYTDGSTLANARGGRFGEQGKGEDELQGGTEVVGGSKDVADSEGSGLEIAKKRSGRKQELPGSECYRLCGGREAKGWWQSERGLDRVAYGVAHRVDRLKAIGNGQVPKCAEAAWKILSGMVET